MNRFQTLGMKRVKVRWGSDLLIAMQFHITQFLSLIHPLCNGWSDEHWQIHSIDQARDLKSTC